MRHASKSTSVTTCRRHFLEARCKERGYTISEVSGCIISQDGDNITVDVSHPAYPREPKPGFAPPPPPEPPPTFGPGTELSKLLKRLGIEPTPTCQCRAMADKMDILGPDECSKPERIEEVVAVMREEAKARGLPFAAPAAKMLIRRAIKNARKATKKQA